MISTVSGLFGQFSATAETNGDDFKDAVVKEEVDVNSISTNKPDRHNHLKSDDFFNAAQFPVMTFVSKSFDGEKLTGDLTIRNITKEVSLEAEYNGIAVDPYGQTKAGFELAGEINRKDFGLKWSAVTEAGSVVVSDKVKIAENVQFVKQ